MAHLDQKEAFEELKSQVLDGIKGHFPVEGRLNRLELEKLEVDDRGLHPDDIRSQQKSRLEGKTWAAPVHATMVLKDVQTGAVKQRRKIKMAEIPHTTRHHGYIVDGQEYQADNQWQLKPGVYTRRLQTGELVSEFNTPNKQSFKVKFDPKKKLFLMDRGKSSSIPVYPLMRALGVGDEELEKTWGKDVLEANKQARAVGTALQRFYKADLKKQAPSVDEATKYFLQTMSESQLRPDSTEVTLGKAFDRPTGETFVRATKKMMGVQLGKVEEDDRDSLVFKDLRSIGDFARDKLTNYKTTSAIRNKMLRQINQARTVRDVVKFDTFNEPIRQTFLKNAAVNPGKQINPVEMMAANMRTTIMGPGGIKSAQAVMDEAKLINPSHLGYLDPIHTPESEKTGVTLHLPLGVKKIGREPTIPVYNTQTKKVERVSPAKFMKENVVLPDQVEWKDGKPVPIAKKVKLAGTQNNEIREGKFEDAKYVMRHPSQMFSVTSNLIPFMGNNSGNRASYADAHIEQAISLLDREEPLVQVGTGAKKVGLRTFEEFIGRNTAHTAPVDGKVVKVTRDGVHIQGKDGKTREVQMYRNFPLNDPKAVLDSEPIVKEGDAVKAGQAVADTNFTRGGKLALGSNLNVAYLPYKGYNYEDGVVISESAAKKLSSVHLHKPALRVEKDVITNPKKFNVQHPEAFTRDQYTLLDDNGVVKKGTVVKPGDPLIVGTRPFQLRDRNGVALVRKSAAGAHTDVSLRWDSDYPGKVVGIHKGKRGETAVHVRTIEPMQVGDKLTGRHGNKGIVTRVLPDEEMPHSKKGERVEVVLNPAGVPGRMNVGQLLETAAGKIAKKTGKPYVVENFGRVDDMVDKIQGELKEHGLEETEELIDPKTGKSLGRATTGPQHMLKLTHQIDKKLSARSGMSITGAPPEAYDNNLIPAGGGKTGGQSIGNLGLYTLLAHGAKSNIREMQTWKSEGPDPVADHKAWRSQHHEVWKAIQEGDPLPPPKSTFSFQKFTDMLRASGVDVTKDGNRVRLTPLTDRQVLAMSNGELRDPTALTRTELDENGEPKPIKGGLFDPKLTGGHGGKKWTHFKLAEPMPNPMFEGAIQKTLGLTQGQYTQLVQSKKAVDPKTGSFVKVGTKGSMTGGVAIAKMLEGLDVKKELSKAKKELAAANIPKDFAQGKSTTKLDKALKRVKYLSTLDELDMSAKDAYTINHLPVLPPAMRPAAVLPGEKKVNVKWEDLNGLYRDLAQVNEKMKDPNFRDYLGDEDKVEQREGLYDGLKALMGVGMSHADRENKNKGVMLQIAGKYPKAGYFQKTLLNRRQDLSMRSTIVPEPAMGLDQVGLPSGKAATLFRPFLVKKMVDIGAAKNPLDAREILSKKESLKDKQVLKALDLVMEERPILLKRDPALHKHSVQSFNAHRVPGRAIQIHPLVTSGYNADFDGDTMSAYVPISSEAVDEAKKMFPSNNLFNEATGKVMNVPTHESALGLYKMSRIGRTTKKKFANPTEALRAVEAGKLKIDDVADIGGMGKTTPGRMLLSTALPTPLQKKMLTDKSMVLDGKGLGELYTNLAKNHRDEFGDAANKLKDFGYGAAYGAVRVPNPAHTGPDAIKAAEKGEVKFLPTTTHSLSLSDFRADKATRNPIIDQTRRRVEMINRSGLSRQQKDQRAVEEWTKATNKIMEAHKVKADKEENNLYLMLKSGAMSKSKQQSYQQVKVAPMLLEDSAGRTIPTPVTKSYAEGLDVAGYWTQMQGARRGTVHKVQEVQEPGYFSKQLINTTMNLQVNGDDCGTQRGVSLPIVSKDVHDRELAADITVRGQKFPKGTLLSPDVVGQIRSADKSAQIPVRSPLKCEHAKGLCQKCAGLSPDGTLHKKGTNLGVLASQSLGERSVQLALRVFHTGGVAGSGGKVVGQFGRIKQLTELPKKIPDAATLAMKSGTVEKVTRSKLGDTVVVGGREHFIPLDRGGHRLTGLRPDMSRGIKWTPPKVGQKIEAGAPLSDPNRTFVNPHDLYKATRSMEKVQNHLVNELHGLYKGEGVRRQHIETVVKGMSNLTRVRDPGDAPGILKGEYQPASQMRAINRDLEKRGRKPIKHTPILQGVDMMPLTVQEDWMAKMNFTRLRGSVQEAAATGGYSDLHGTHPIPGMAYAAEFGLTEKQKRRSPRLRKLPPYGY